MNANLKHNIEAVETFVRQADRRPVVVACPADAAGLAAGELARRLLVARGAQVAAVIAPNRGELLVARRLADRAQAAGARALLALDLGASAEAVLADGPTLFVDVHRHQANLAAPVIDATESGPPIPAAVILWPMARELAQADPWLYLAALAAEAGHPKVDLAGDLAPARRFSKSSLREAAVLLNSAGRSSQYQTAAALALLGRHDSPQDLLDDESPELSRLHEARTEVMRAVAQWSRTRPRFMWRVALVPVSSPCRIEPILAAMWERQLGKYMIVVANSGLAPGLVTVTARTADPGRNLLRLLDAVTPEESGEPIALGCRDYLEAVVPTELWKEMLRKMHFRNARELVPPPQEATLF